MRSVPDQDRNQEHGAAQAPLEDTQAADDAQRVREDRPALCSRQCRPLGVPAPAQRAGTHRTRTQGGEVPGSKPARRVRLRHQAQCEQATGPPAGPRGLSGETRECVTGRPLRDWQVAPRDSLRHGCLCPRQTCAVLSCYRADHSTPRSQRRTPAAALPTGTE